MEDNKDFVQASEGKMWVLTEEGFLNSPKSFVGCEVIGKPVGTYSNSIPREWMVKDWFTEIDKE